ncbi:MAG: hypothetical protein KDK24_15040 [Pseudooceanicola sp.]|nr:hypothetical protein [Pseudooceanicola sp.]
MSRIFTVIAHARSGSTLLCRKLDERAEGRVYLELFHRNLKTIFNHLADSGAAVRDRFAPLDGAELRDHLAAHPMALLHLLSELNGGRDIYFKVFPGHLARPQLQEVLANSAGAILLHRNLLHSFLSNEIAQARQKWTNDDTSKDTVAFDPKRFAGNVRTVLNFYDEMEELLTETGTPRTDILYETIADPDRADAAVTAALEALGVTSAKQPPPKGRLNRQDSRRLASDKVSNPDEMLALLDAIGLTRANDGDTPVAKPVFAAALKALRARS